MTLSGMRVVMNEKDTDETGCHQSGILRSNMFWIGLITIVVVTIFCRVYNYDNYRSNH